MSVYVALLRAVNVGGTGKLPMAELRALCEQIGMKHVRTYIQSGNVVCASPLKAAQVAARIEQALAVKLGKACRVFVRTLPELERTEADNPFPEAEANRVLVVFLDEAPPPGALEAVVVPGRERLAIRGRELFVHYPDGMGQSKLKLPFAAVGTGRNLNTLRALIALARS